MFYNNQNDGNNKPSVNTHYESFFGDLSYMIVSGWDANVSFKFAPCVGTNDSGRKQYDKDRTVTSALTHPKIAALLAQYETKMELKIMKIQGKAAFVSGFRFVVVEATPAQHRRSSLNTPAEKKARRRISRS